MATEPLNIKLVFGVSGKPELQQVSHTLTDVNRGLAGLKGKAGTTSRALRIAENRVRLLNRQLRATHSKHLRLFDRGLQVLTRTLTRFAQIGLGVVIAQIAVAGFAIRGLVREFLEVNEQFAGLEISLKSAFRSQKIAGDLKEQIRKISLVSPIPLKDLSNAVRGLSILPQLRGAIAQQSVDGTLNAKEGILNKTINLVEKLVAFRPDRSAADAVFSIREALGGELRSLIRRFDVPPEILEQASGLTQAQLKKQPLQMLEAMHKAFSNIVTDEAIGELIRQPKLLFANLQEALISQPLLKIGDQGIYNQVVGFFSDLFTEAQVFVEKDLPRMAQEMSDDLGTVFESITSRLAAQFENFLSFTGAGEEDLPGLSQFERAYTGVGNAISAIGDKLPIVLDAVIDFAKAMLPILKLLTNLVVGIAKFVGTSRDGAISGPLEVASKLALVASAPTIAKAATSAGSGAIIRGQVQGVANLPAGATRRQAFGQGFGLFGAGASSASSRLAAGKLAASSRLAQLGIAPGSNQVKNRAALASMSAGERTAIFANPGNIFGPDGKPKKGINNPLVSPARISNITDTKAGQKAFLPKPRLLSNPAIAGVGSFVSAVLKFASVLVIFQAVIMLFQKGVELFQRKVSEGNQDKLKGALLLGASNVEQAQQRANDFSVAARSLTDSNARIAEQTGSDPLTGTIFRRQEVESLRVSPQALGRETTFPNARTADGGLSKNTKGFETRLDQIRTNLTKSLEGDTVLVARLMKDAAKGYRFGNQRLIDAVNTEDLGIRNVPVKTPENITTFVERTNQLNQEYVNAAESLKSGVAIQSEVFRPGEDISANILTQMDAELNIREALLERLRLQSNAGTDDASLHLDRLKFSLSKEQLQELGEISKLIATFNSDVSLPDAAFSSLTRSKNAISALDTASANQAKSQASKFSTEVRKKANPFAETTEQISGTGDTFKQAFGAIDNFNHAFATAGDSATLVHAELEKVTESAKKAKAKLLELSKGDPESLLIKEKIAVLDQAIYSPEKLLERTGNFQIDLGQQAIQGQMQDNLSNLLESAVKDLVAGIEKAKSPLEGLRLSNQFADNIDTQREELFGSIIEAAEAGSDSAKAVVESARLFSGQLKNIADDLRTGALVVGTDLEGVDYLEAVESANAARIKTLRNLVFVQRGVIDREADLNKRIEGFKDLEGQLSLIDESEQAGNIAEAKARVNLLSEYLGDVNDYLKVADGLDFKFDPEGAKRALEGFSHTTEQIRRLTGGRLNFKAPEITGGNPLNNPRGPEQTVERAKILGASNRDIVRQIQEELDHKSENRISMGANGKMTSQSLSAQGIADMEEAKLQFEEAALGYEDLVRSIEGAGNPFETFHTGFMQVFSDFKTQAGNLKQVGADMGAALTQSFSGAFTDFITGAATAEDAFRSFAKGMLDSMAQIAAQKASEQLLGMIISGISTLAQAPSAPTTGATPPVGMNVPSNTGNFSGFTSMTLNERGGILAMGGIFDGPLHAQGGIPVRNGETGQMYEVEGGEAIINRKATSMYRSELSAINASTGGAKFAQGGLLAANNSPMQSMNSGKSDVTVNVSMTEGGGSSVSLGSSSGSTEQDQKDARELGKAIAVLVDERMAAQRRVGGIDSRRRR